MFNDFGDGNNLNISRLTLACHGTCAVPALITPAYVPTAKGASEIYSAVDNDEMNPVSEIIDEARRLFPGQKIAVVVSLGCGAPPSSPTERRSSKWNPVLSTMDVVYKAAEMKARGMAAE